MVNPPPPVQPASDNGAANIVVEPLTTVNFAYAQFTGDMRLIDSLGADILRQYESTGVTGQGTSFPLFTHDYLRQDTRSKVPPEILKWVQDCCQAFLVRQAPYLKIEVTAETIYPLWANVNRAGEYHAAHNHGMGEYVLSGVFFVSTPSDLKEEGEGLLILERSQLPSIEGRFDMVYRAGEKLPVKPMPGWIVLFPPFVRHYVTPHMSSQPRISVAFNVLSSAVLGPK